MGVLESKIGGGVVRYCPPPNELIFTLVGCVCANFCENRARNETVRVLADGCTERLTDANRFYSLGAWTSYDYEKAILSVEHAHIKKRKKDLSRFFYHTNDYLA